MQAERPDIAGREGAPPDQQGRQRLPDLAGAQPHQAVSGSAGERIGQAGRNPGIEFRPIVVAFGDQVSVRGEAQSKSRHAVILRR